MGPFPCPLCTWLLWASVPRVPSHRLDTPAEFTSLTRSPLPPQGRLLPGTFEQALGTQFEAEIGVMQEKGQRGQERGLRPAQPRLQSPAWSSWGSGMVGGSARISMTPYHPVLPVRTKTGETVTCVRLTLGRVVIKL